MGSRSDTLEAQIKARAIRLGFSIVGITDAAPLEEFPIYQGWLDQGNHAGMAYLQSPFHQQRRHSPDELLPGTKSVIVLGLSYPLHSPERVNDPSLGLISGYTVGMDYHERIPRMLTPLVDFLRRDLGEDSQIRVFSDSAPILERELAVRAGLGWIGRNSCLVSPTAGSTVLLAEIFIDKLLQPDQPFLDDHCGTCKRCVKACPTTCILPDRTIDARGCISYHTIENRGEIPQSVMSKQGNWVFGCDICQMVCPWNHKSIDPLSAPLLSTELMRELTREPLLSIQECFKHSAVLRAKPADFLRNLLVVLANQANLTEKELLEVIGRVDTPGINKILDWITEN